MAQSPEYPFRSAEARQEFLASYDRQAQKWPLVSENRLVETSQGRTFVRINGPAEAQPLVLLPGRYGTSLSWVPAIAALSASYRTYALDSIFDIGRSQPARPLKRLADYLGWLDELFTALGLGDQIRLMGISYGGWLAAQYALRFPERLARLVLIAPAATVLPIRLEWWARSLPGALHPRFFSSFAFWIFADLAHQSEDAPELLGAAIQDMQLALRCYQRELGVNPTALSDRRLASLPAPALFIVGEREKLYSPHRAVERLNRLAPQVKTAIIPGAGHDLLDVQTALVTAKVLEFLE